MSSLTDIEKRYFEKLLGMQGGYVLDYSNATFGEFFKRHKVDINGQKYLTYGTSKAKKMRAFWEQEPDALVGKVLEELLEAYEADCSLNNRDTDSGILDKSRASWVKPGRQGRRRRSTSFCTASFRFPTSRSCRSRRWQCQLSKVA